VKNEALEGHNNAEKFSKTMNTFNPNRLGLALNINVFHYEVMNNLKKACVLGEAALTEAL
jgi:hypothetical protein